MKYLLASLVLVCSSAQAQIITGNRLLSDINSSSVTDKAFAMGVVASVADSFDNDVFCITPRATVGQMTDLTRQYLEENPKHRHRPAVVLVLIALADAFPCEKKGKSL